MNMGMKGKKATFVAHVEESSMKQVVHSNAFVKGKMIIGIDSMSYCRSKLKNCLTLI